MRSKVMAWWLMAAGILPGVPVAAESALWVVERDSVAELLCVDGVIEAVNQGTASAQTQGRVLRWHVDVDSVVEKGQLLLELDATEQQARKEQAQAQVAEAKARVTEAEQQFERVRQLFAKGTVSRSQLDSAEATRQAALARVDLAVAALAEAAKQVSHTRVLAPYAGIVTARHIEVGELATPGKALISGFSLEEVRVTAMVPQAHADAVRRHGEVSVGLPDGRRLAALHPLVYPYADPQNHHFRLRADLAADSGLLYPGTWVKLWLRTGERKAIHLPLAALVQRDELRAVYVVGEDGRVSLRQVRIGRRSGEQVEILAGLQAGERVALDPSAVAGSLVRQSAAAGEVQ